MNRDFELKALVLYVLLFMVATLVFTTVRDKKRPIFLLVLYLSYIFFQCLYKIEFFPLTAFQMYSFPEEKAAKYQKLIVILEDGQKLDLKPHDVLPMLSDGRVKRFARESFDNPQIANEFATAFAKAYDRRFRKGGPGIKEIRFEKWKWDFFLDPHDDERGYMMKRVIGRPEEGSASNA